MWLAVGRVFERTRRAALGARTDLVQGHIGKIAGGWYRRRPHQGATDFQARARRKVEPSDEVQTIWPPPWLQFAAIWTPRLTEVKFSWICDAPLLV